MPRDVNLEMRKKVDGYGNLKSRNLKNRKPQYRSTIRASSRNRFQAISSHF